MFHAVRLLALVALPVLVLLPSTSSAAEVKVQLQPQNNSGESGTATLMEEGGKTKVSVDVSGTPSGTPQPMHVHKGTCANLDPKPTYGLPALADGKAEATLDVSLKDLQGEKYAINGHKSAQEVSVYVFCGEIPSQ